MRRFAFVAVLFFVLGGTFSWSQAAQQPGAAAPPAPTAATSAAPAFDVEAATNAYLAKMTSAEKSRSDAYFEGGYWLLLWNLLYTVAVASLLLWSGFSAKMRAWAEMITIRKWLQTAIYSVEFSIVLFVLTLPWTIYTDYFREHQYGLSNMTFGGWFKDQLIGAWVSTIFAAILITVIFIVLRRAERTWWIWGAGVALVFMVIGMLVTPVFILPLFNKYTPLEDPKVKAPILAMARANGINVTNVYEQNASKQSKRVSAFVVGFGSTQRVVLNDNLLQRCSLAEIEAVMGHEMGHYVLNHIYKGLLEFGVIIVLFFAYLYWVGRWVLARWGARWKVRGVSDPAVIPAAMLLASLFFFVLTPVTNTIVRSQELEADFYGLNAAAQPDGEAEVVLKLGEYRKMSPTPLEEFIFYDHPSGRTRIHNAMQWKAEHLSQLPAVPIDGTAK